MSTTSEVRLRIRRPVRTAYYTEEAIIDGPPILPGATVVVTVLADKGETFIDEVRVEPRPSGHDYDFCDALRGAALVPCEHLQMESGDEPYTADYYACSLFNGYADELVACMGDRTRCPYKEVRVQAAAFLVTETEAMTP